MKLSFRFEFALIFSCVLALIGCSSSANPPQSQSNAQLRAQDAKAPAGNVLTAAPQSLKDTGEYAENIYDAANTRNWKAASGKLALLNNATAKLHGDIPSAPEVSEIESRASALQNDISAKNKLASMTESNEITRLAAELSGKFESPVPVQVVTLDYLGRKLQIESVRKDLAALKQTTSEIRSNWNDLKPRLEQKGASGEEKRFDSIVQNLEAAKVAGQFAQLAKRELAEVDNLEKVLVK